MKKTCTKCGIEKALHMFSNAKTYKYGVNSICRKCEKIENKLYKLNHKEQILKYQHEYYLKNKEKILEYFKIYCKNNKEKRKEIIKKSDLKCKERVQNYKNQPHIKIAHRLRNRIRLVLIGKSKSDSTLNLLGCSFKFLKNYLELKFTLGMNWDNYGIGGWEIDHIKPCASFDLSKPEEQHKCFHYKNLQPLWYNKNRAKNNRKIGI